jgi:hypothetical protein
MAFKGESDDKRESLSYKLRRLLMVEAREVICTDPDVPDPKLVPLGEALRRAYFGEIDPFGDFDLLFGAARYNLKILDLPIRYRERKYGEANIQRWRHGLLLLRMVLLASRRIRFV